MNRTAIRLALSIMLIPAFATCWIALPGCSGGEAPKAEGKQKPFARRFANSGDSPREKASQRVGPKAR
jgi:hypothetical protein